MRYLTPALGLLVSLACGTGCYRTSKLHMAALNNDVGAIREYVDEDGARVDKRVAGDRTALHMATSRGQVEAARALVERGARPDAADRRGDTPLMMAASRGYTDLVRMFLVARPDLNQQNRTGRTALHFAARREHPEVVEMLVRAGADPTIRDRRGRTAADMAKSSDTRRLLRDPPAPAALPMPRAEPRR